MGDVDERDTVLSSRCRDSPEGLIEPSRKAARMTHGQMRRAILCVLLGLSACSGEVEGIGPSAAQGVVVEVTPPAPEILPGGAVTFVGTVTGAADTGVLWDVVEPGGGTVDDTGRYTAPLTTGRYQVRASSRASPAVQAIALVTVTTTPAILVAISPSSSSLLAGGTTSFTAIVTGATDTAVTWSVRETSGCGSITQAGVYSAPASAATCHVVATSRAQTSSSATATVTVTAAPQPPPSGTCSAEPLRTTGTTYFYCDCAAGAAAGCVPGNDANAGTSASAPRRTGWKDRFTSMAAGSTVALCRGGAFAGDGNHTRNANCSAASTCDLRDYVDPRFTLPAGETRPVINGGRLVYLPDNGAHYEGFRFFNLQVANSMTGQGAVFGSGNSTDLDVCNVYIHDGDLAVYWSDPVVSRWTVRQSQFDRLSNPILGGCTDCVLDSNYFANTSYTPNSNREHPIYISGEGVQRMRVTNNEVHGCPPGVTTGTVLLVVHGNHTDLLIENNLVQCDNPGSVNPGNYGISLDNGSYTSGNVGQERNSIVRRNRVIHNGEYGISLSQAPGSIVEDNIVVLPPGASGYTGIIAGNHAPRSQDPVNERITIRNNTIYAPSSSHTGITVMREGTGHVVANNVVYYGGTAGQCFDLPLAASAYASLTTNACNGSWGTSLDSNRVVLTGLPFVAAGADFTPAAGSPLVDAATTSSFSSVAVGSPTWSATDTGMARDGQPDIGAHER